MHHGKYHITIYRLQNIATKIMPVNEKVNNFTKLQFLKLIMIFIMSRIVNFFWKLKRKAFYLGRKCDKGSLEKI